MKKENEREHQEQNWKERMGRNRKIFRFFNFLRPVKRTLVIQCQKERVLFWGFKGVCSGDCKHRDLANVRTMSGRQKVWTANKWRINFIERARARDRTAIIERAEARV